MNRCWINYERPHESHHACSWNWVKVTNAAPRAVSSNHVHGAHSKLNYLKCICDGWLSLTSRLGACKRQMHAKLLLWLKFKQSHARCQKLTENKLNSSTETKENEEYKEEEGREAADLDSSKSLNHLAARFLVFCCCCRFFCCLPRLLSLIYDSNSSVRFGE